MIHISVHACERYIERVDSACTIREARAAIRSHERALEAAASIGCNSIRLACGARLILRDGGVVTVTPILPKQRRHNRQRSGHALDFKAIGRQWRYSYVEG